MQGALLLGRKKYKLRREFILNLKLSKNHHSGGETKRLYRLVLKMYQTNIL